MKSLKDEIGIKKIIYKITANNIRDAVKKSFADEKYKFYLNSELIDVNNRFRIFKYKNINYVAKKSKLENGKREYLLAKKAYEKLNDISIGKYEINVVLPNVVIVDDFAYIISEYKGCSLQESLYSGKVINLLELDFINKLLEKFLELGILYRGFLPRNTVVEKEKVYLLDWEDTIFCSKNDAPFINKLWKTNFLLNWSYFYDYNALNKIIGAYDNFDNEPPLIKYEQKFKDWTNYKLSDSELRDKIMQTVFFAEGSIKVSSDKFCIPPADMAHLISDIFYVDIDVLFDITSYLIRKHNEEMYTLILINLSQLIVYLYKNKYNLRKYLIRVILIMIELASNKCDSVLNLKNYDDVLNVEKLSSFELVSSLYANNDFDKLLKIKLVKVIENFTLEKNVNIDVAELCNYIVKIYKEGEDINDNIRE